MNFLFYRGYLLFRSR